jgi:glucose/arabinose dehydrogenase
VKESKVVVDDPNLNHGIDIHPDGKKIVASTPDVAYEFDYNADKMEAGTRKALVTGMQGPGHNTRTLLIPRKNTDYLVVSVGSGSNIDEGAFQTSSGRAQIRTFKTKDLGSEGSAFTDDNAGKVMAFGMRNAVGLAEDREGNIHAVDNSVDDAYRVSIVTNQVLDVHEDNPAEKAYVLGKPDSPNSNFFAGAPYCYTVYDPKPFTDVSVKPGDYFALQPNSSFNDGWCESNAQPPELILAPHVAPLDMKFGVKKDDNNLYIGMHGSFDTDQPIGYKVVIVSGHYNSGKWAPASGVQTPTTDLLANQDETKCDKGCFRPVGLAFDKDGNNLFVSSDTSGEVFLVKRGNGAFSGFQHHPPAVAVALVFPALLYAISGLL